ncbi:MAG: DegV family protein [Adlercreutzia equolifaciens]
MVVAREHLVTSGQKTDLKQFYTMMREGKVITTSLPNRRLPRLLEGLLASGGMCSPGFSGLSATRPSTFCWPSWPTPPGARCSRWTPGRLHGRRAARLVRRQDARRGVHHEVRDWEAAQVHLAHWFTVDDLMFLFRGGRVSRTSAWAGTLLNIKPVMHVDDEGHLIPLEKVRGRKKSLKALVDHMAQTATSPVADQTVFISHGDCIEDAEYVADLVRERFGVTDILINYVDPVIGAHSGPGTMALFFLASER